MTNTITDLLNISPVIIEQDEPKAMIEYTPPADIVPDEAETEFEADFDLVRANLKNLVERGDDALETLLNLADSSMQPRAYEIAALTLKTLVDTNMNILDIHEKRKKMKVKSDESKPNSGIVNNIENAVLFSGSTSDILKRLNK